MLFELSGGMMPIAAEDIEVGGRSSASSDSSIIEMELSRELEIK